MHFLFASESLEDIYASIAIWVYSNIWNFSALIQAVVTTCALAVAYALSRPMSRFLKEHHLVKPQHEQIKESIATLVVAVSWVVVQAIVVGLSVKFQWPNQITRIVLSLLLVWVFARFVSSFVKDALLSKLLAITAWSVAALHIVGLLDPTIAVLSQIGLRVGDLYISVLDFAWGAVVLLLLLWAANSTSSHLESRINQRTDLEPAIKVLFGKLLRTFLIGCAFLFGFSALGVDVSFFTVFGGAIGLGLGFGLQKVISNLICGVILLLDRSIKPGDVISLKDGKTYGTVNQLSARFVAIRTPAGEEHLIPNEEIITQGVENWSYSDRNIRLALPVRVELDADVRHALELLVDAAGSVRRVLSFPRPAARVKGFSEWAIELELLVWINDPENGLSGVKSDLYLNIWDAFKREGINFPIPSRRVFVDRADDLLQPVT
jgi:small-conductance mechanosensitive channel